VAVDDFPGSFDAGVDLAGVPGEMLACGQRVVKGSLSKDRSRLSSPPVRRRRMIHSLIRAGGEIVQSRSSATLAEITSCSYQAVPLAVPLAEMSAN